jgi:hypothetical protein
MKIIFVFCFLIISLNSYSYRIEIQNKNLINTPVFLVGYYGDKTSVVDSTMADIAGRAVFQGENNLCVGMYMILAPGKLQYDILLDDRQLLRLEWISDQQIVVEGDPKIAAWIEYNNLFAQSVGRRQLAYKKHAIIEEYPGTLIAAYMTALQINEPPQMGEHININQLLREYRDRRRNFFANMPLSDVRLLRTPLYHETIDYFTSQFITQHIDSLIAISYSMLEQAAGNTETFFYVSDFMIDFYARNRSNISNSDRLYNFIQRNRNMLGSAGMSMLNVRSRSIFFTMQDEVALRNRLSNIQMIDTEGEAFNPRAINSRFKVFYFWKNSCQRCILEAARLQAIINNYSEHSFCIMVNIENDVIDIENRMIAYDPLFINVSAANSGSCETLFLATYYSKILLTDNAGNVLGAFSTTSALADFLRLAQ